MSRIVDPKDAAIVNRELTNKLDNLRKEFNTLRKAVQSARGNSLLDQDHLRHAMTVNNLIFTWNGPASTLSWSTGYIVEPRSNTTYPVLAGTSPVLSASTHYWCVFNHAQRIMSFTRDLKSALTIIHNIAICRVFTGTAGQSGVAGGGGSNSGSDLSGAVYKTF